MGLSSTLGLLFEINADPSHALTAVKLLEEEVSTKLSSALGISQASFSQYSSAVLAAARDLTIVGGVVVTAGAGALKLAEHAAEMGNKIYEAGQKTGMTAPTLSGIMAVAKETGRNFEGLATGFARATRNLTEAAHTGKGAIAELFTEAELQSLKLKPVDEQMHIVLQRIFALTDAGERNRDLQALFGRAWMENVGVLKTLAAEGYGPAIERAKQYSIYYDEKSARDAHNFVVEMNALKAQYSGLALTLGKELMPYAIQFLAWLHTAKQDAEEGVLWLAALSGAAVTFGASLLLIPKAIKIQNEAYEEQNRWLVELQKQLKGAVEAIKDLDDKQTHAATHGGAGPGGALAAAFKAQSGAAQDLGTKLKTVAVELHNDLIPPLAELPVALRENAAAFVPFIEETDKAVATTHQLAAAVHTTAQAMDSELAAQAAGTVIKTAGLIAGRRAQAGVEAIWETARGIACLAEGIWPPNPAAIIAAGTHFEAAAQYAVMAGSHAARPTAAGAGGPAGEYAGRDREGRSLYPPQTPAYAGPGAGGGRYGSPGTGIIVVHGSTDFHAFVAAAVTDAANAGHTVIATQSQRGAPVGH
jgi:hypothetical protein